MNENKNNVKLCFYARAGQLEIYAAIAQKLAAHNVDIVFVTQDATETNYIKTNVENPKIYEIEEFLKKNWDKHPNENAEALLKSYDNIWRVFYTDRFLTNYNTEDCKKMIELHFVFFDELFRIEKPNFFVNEAVSIFAAYVALITGQKYDCRYIGTIIARDNAREQFYFFDDLYQRNKEMERLYEEDKFDQFEIEKATEYLREFRSKSKTPAYMEKHKKQPRFTLKLPLYLAKYLLYRNDKRFTDKVSYTTYNMAFEILAEPLIHFIQYKRSEIFYKKPIEGEEYYLYTLHFQPEASTLVCAEKYEKQLFAIDNIAKSIPYDCMLYVKEHYACLGSREISFYKELLKYPNVRLIDPYCDIHKLIKESRAVIVLTNTTGFEAILHGKKVFVLGEVFYDFFEDVEKIADVYTEAKKFKNVETQAGDSKIVKFICAYQKSLLDGCVAPMFEECLSNENIQSLTNNLKKFANLV